MAQAALDADHLGTDARALVRRLGFAISAVANVALAISAIDLIFNVVASDGGDASARDWTQYLLSLPFGQGIVALVRRRTDMGQGGGVGCGEERGLCQNIREPRSVVGSVAGHLVRHKRGATQ